jgi:hypothetical protein
MDSAKEGTMLLVDFQGGAKLVEDAAEMPSFDSDVCASCVAFSLLVNV